MPNLLLAADTVRQKIRPLAPSINDDTLVFPSVYNNGKGMRGFCNWLLPGIIMIGQYPGQTPEANGPSQEEVKQHICLLVEDAGVNFFCSLQSEIPAQTDTSAWEKHGGQVYLEEYLRDDFPRPFTHYAPLVQSLSTANAIEPVFLHYPIDDLSVPNSQPIQALLMQLLQTLDDENVIYLHCWGGRGRAGLVGASLVSLLFPELDSKAILDLVQSAYDTRAGAQDMPVALSRSPQTEQQRNVKACRLETYCIGVWWNVKRCR